MLNLIISGLPGSGKGTQSKLMLEKYNELAYLETGEVFRKASRKENELGRKIEQHLEKGDLIPDNHVNQLVQDFVKQKLTQSKGVLFDGYPRTIQQAKFLDKVMKECNTEIHHFLYLRVPEGELIERMLNRGREAGINEEFVQKRIKSHQKELEPVKGHYKNRNKLSQIDGNQSIDQIHQEILSMVE